MTGDVFGKVDPEEQQLELYEEQLAEYQKHLDRLEGEDTPEAAEQRQSLGVSIYETQVKMEQIKLSQQQSQDRIDAIEPSGMDIFRD